MGKMQRDKGNRIEREIVNILKKNNINAKRVPLSGSANGFKGDIVIESKNKTFRCEVKARKDGFKLIYKNLPKIETGSLKLITEKNRLAVLKIDEFVKILKGNKLNKYTSNTLHRKLKQIDQWIADNDILFIKANRKPILALVRLSDYIKMQKFCGEEDGNKTTF